MLRPSSRNVLCWHAIAQRSEHELLTCGHPLQVMNAWLACFHAMAPVLDKGMLKSKILPLALSKGANDNTSVQARVVCCALLGSLAPRLSKVCLPVLSGRPTCKLAGRTPIYYNWAAVAGIRQGLLTTTAPAGGRGTCLVGADRAGAS